MEWDARGSVSGGRFFIGTVQRQFSQGAGSIRRVFYCPKTDRYQDYVFPSTSQLVSAIESDTKPVNRREEEEGGGGES